MPNPKHPRRPIAIAAERADTAFDIAVNWLSEHPRLTCALVCAVALIPLFVDVPR